MNLLLALKDACNMSSRDVSRCSYCGLEHVEAATVCAGCGKALFVERSAIESALAKACETKDRTINLRSTVIALHIGVGLLILFLFMSRRAYLEREQQAARNAPKLNLSPTLIGSSGQPRGEVDETNFAALAEQYRWKAKILVKGDRGFQQRVYEALALLEQKAPEKYAFVREHVCVVLRGRMDFTDIWTDPPIVFLSNPMEWDLEICAGALVHEAKHIEQMRISQQSHNGGFVYKEVAGAKTETEANRIDAETLRELGGSTQQAEYLENDLGAYWSNFATKQLGATGLNSALESTQIHWPTPLSRAMPELWKELEALRADSSFAEESQATNRIRSTNR